MIGLKKLSKTLVASEQTLLESGQTLVEFVITYLLLFLCALAVIEIARLIAFKNCLQSVTSYLAHKIAYTQIDLMEKHKIPEQGGIFENENRKFSDQISGEIENYLNLIASTRFSYDNNETNTNQSGVLFIKKHDVRVYLKFVNNSQSFPSGVYIESQTCLPVLFSSYFRHFKTFHNEKGVRNWSEENIVSSASAGNVEIGKRVEGQDRTCLGHFNFSSKVPLQWFRVRVSAYSPWPASTQIFKHGLALPPRFKSLEQENRNDILKAINSNKLTKIFANIEAL